MRLLFVQYAGDYRKAVQHFAQGEGETYYAQKYSVDAVAKIGKQVEEVAVLCAITAEPYDEILDNGVRAIGAGFQQGFTNQELVKLIAEQNPTHLIARTPLRGIYQWAIQNKVPTLSILADSFSNKSLRNKIRNFQLSRLLNNKQIQWVSNHGVQSSLSLQEIGVSPNKIIPWDWPSLITPDSFSAKTLRSNVKNWHLIYVGSVTELKGVGDVLEALAKLREKEFPVTLKIAGRGETEYFFNKAKQLNIESCVEFMGLVPNQDVVKLMRASDLVLIPSRHEYPEGFPMTVYEALCSRTPIIASDHPMFKGNLKHEINAMLFPAANSTILSEMIKKLINNPELYKQISAASYEAWQRLQIPVKWADLVERWVDNSPENQQWLFEHRLSSGRYNSIL
jgi:glycosyltransferase involved in cell wall biosynthesis